MANELKPCPFCGKVPELRWRGSAYIGFYARIKCESCNMVMEHYNWKCDKAKSEIADKWNRRVDRN